MKNWLFCFKGLLAGFIISIIGTVGYIVLLYVPVGDIWFYFMAVPSSIGVFFALKNNALKPFILSIIIMLISFVICEIAINSLQIVQLFYYSKYPDATEFSMGDGFAMAIMYIFDLFGAIVGTILAFIKTISCIGYRRKRKHTDF